MLLLYLDPGTGSLLLYALVGIVTSLFVVAKQLLSKLRLFFLGRNSVDNSEYDVVIYSDMGGGIFIHLKN